MKRSDDRDRRSVRLSGHDYTRPGSYFVTIVCQDRTCDLGTVRDGVMILSDLGEIVEDEWRRSVEMRRDIDLDAFVVMPNHFHGLVTITDVSRVGAHGRAPLQEPPAHGRARLHRPARSLWSFVAAFKAASTRRINALRGTTAERLWQRNYYDRVVRDRRELYAVRQYIANNPATWNEDPEHPTAVAVAP